MDNTALVAVLKQQQEFARMQQMATSPAQAAVRGQQHACRYIRMLSLSPLWSVVAARQAAMQAAAAAAMAIQVSPCSYPPRYECVHTHNTIQ